MTTTIEKTANPQGKGLATVLVDWIAMQPKIQGRKTPADFLRDYCFSSLVLSAHFRFKPVAGQRYYIYYSEKGWILSLIAPIEWGKRAPGFFLAPCMLRADMTWQVDTTLIDDTSKASEMAQDFIRAFIHTLVKQESISAHLPVYVAHRPYYQRMLGTALASSLRQSLPIGINDMQSFLNLADSKPMAKLMFKP